jgi:DNA modification methylase
MLSLFDEKYTISEKYDGNADITLLYGDVLAELKTVPNNIAQLIISSPPYNLGKEYEQATGLEEYLQWQSQIIGEMFRVCHTNGSIVRYY